MLGLQTGIQRMILGHVVALGSRRRLLRSKVLKQQPLYWPSLRLSFAVGQSWLMIKTYISGTV